MSQPLVTPIRSAAGKFPNEATIQRWLRAHVAALMQQSADDIDITQPFSSFALDSVATVGMTGDLEEWLGVSLEPTLIWDYPSIELLARHLAALDQS